jgi:hypothetical protein
VDSVLTVRLSVKYYDKLRTCARLHSKSGSYETGTNLVIGFWRWTYTDLQIRIGDWASRKTALPMTASKCYLEYARSAPTFCRTTSATCSLERFDASVVARAKESSRSRHILFLMAVVDFPELSSGHVIIFRAVTNTRRDVMSTAQ